jgi:DNA-binding transcriptional regulator GbsR (MarR family)
MNMAEDIKSLYLELEKKLIQTIANMSYQKGRSPKFSTIAAYSYVREKVTQKTLHEITGYSRGTISIILQKLVDEGILDQVYDKKTRQYIYENNGTLRSILGGSLTNARDFFSFIIDKFNEVEEALKSEVLKSKRGYIHINEFVQEMKDLMPAYQQVMRKYQLPKSNS